MTTNTEHRRRETDKTDKATEAYRIGKAAGDRIAELENQVKNSGWSPMETAPQDGSLIITRRKSGDVSIASWGRCTTLASGFNAGGNRDCWRALGNVRRVPEPTHWMPLPPTPAHKRGE